MKIIETQDAPKPIGPYSQAITMDRLLFCSGQVGLDPATGQMVAGGVERQTEQVLKNLSAVLQKAGASGKHVVKTTIFLKSMQDFPKVNEIYGRFFQGHSPARSTVEVSALPKDALVEIEAIAWLQ